MTTDNDTNFGPVVTSPSAFGMVFQIDKDMPALNCVDLFPNPPRQIDEASQDVADSVSLDNTVTDLNNLSNENSLSYNENKETDNEELSNETSSFKPVTDTEVEAIDKELSNEIPSFNLDTNKEVETLQKDENQIDEFILDNKTNEEIVLPAIHEIPHIEGSGEDRKTPNKLQFPLPVVSPALSISSHYSSAESVSSATSSSKKKKRKRTCVTCGLDFPHKSDLLEHLKMHVGQPSIHLENLSDDNVHLQEYRERQNSLSNSPSANEEHSQSSTQQLNESPQQNETGGLKLKLKLSGIQSFQVVPMNRLTEKCEPAHKKPNERILTAQEVKQSISPSLNLAQNDAPIGPIATDVRSDKQIKADNNLLENKYFECPTLDGLDQYAEEINNEAAEELLKKLLEGGQQLPQDNDWTSNTNEFISIDRLAYMCPICNANFPDAMRLYDHKRITGHDFQHPMHPPPPPMNMQNLDMGTQYRFRPPFQPHLSNSAGMLSNCGPPDNIRPNLQTFQQQQQSRFIPATMFNQAPQARRPPPLYRVPNPQNAHPINMAPFAEMNPEMYIPSSNGHITANGHFIPNQPHIDRQPVFLKARLQRPTHRPRTPGMYERSPNGTPSPPVILSQQTITRPRFLGPMPTQMSGPPVKKIKQEPETDDCQIVSPQPRNDGFPVIQSVQGGAAVNQAISNERPKDPIQLNDQITLSIKNKEQNKNPKEVASILANRGITVTHKPKPPGTDPSRETSPRNTAHEAVQKLQLNNSVSIISKKRPFEPMEELNRPRPDASPFLTCPFPDCEEKYPTQESLNRHSQRAHKTGKIGMKAFKCRLCPAMFSTQEGLMEHQRKSHRLMKTSADEVGIPIIDLRNEETKRKLAQLGIVNYIPLNAKSTNGCFGFPIVSVQGAANPNICNMMGMGVNSLLSLGPIKQIPLRKVE